MALTPAQQAALKANVLADQALNGLPQNSDGAFEIARVYNLNAVPDFYIWRRTVSQDEIMQNGFDWVRVDNLSIGKARIWDWLFKNQNTSINPSKANVRAGIAEIWKGTAADNAVRFAVFGHCQRLASRAEKLFSIGVGVTTDTNGVGPATTELDANLSYFDVMLAMGW